jgi:excisionase family DNA binding protein
MTGTEWLTVQEAAERAKAGVSSILRALADESLRGHQKRRGGKWRIDAADLDAWVRGDLAPVVTNRRSA